VLRVDPISVVAERGSVVESRHRVHAVAVRGDEVVEIAGDPELVTFMRSVAKPLQALPLAVAVPDLPDEELAIACASHDATPDQLDAVRALLRRAGVDEEALECGPEHGSRLRHNCSGKHAGMLLLARVRGWPLEGYSRPDHPLQAEIRAIVAAATGLGDIAEATDGCGVPTFAVPISAMARAFARLAAGALPGAERVTAVMRAHPELVGGPNAPDTALMRAAPGVLAKRGAEGLICAALPDGTGVCVKVEDGANRAGGPALAAVLGLETLQEQPVFNSRGEQVGRLFPSWKKEGSLFPNPL
jgi:L-asparaginase II